MPSENFSNGFTTDRSNPCLGCTERHLRCHGICSKRAEWLKVWEARKAHLRAYNDATATSIEGALRVTKSVKTNGLIYGSKFKERTQV